MTPRPTVAAATRRSRKAFGELTGQVERLRELDESRLTVLALEPALADIERAAGRIEHFAFGGLTALQWLRVMAIHTRHHLKIIEGIQRSHNAS
jgi:hypothetical protein